MKNKILILILTFSVKLIGYNLEQEILIAIKNNDISLTKFYLDSGAKTYSIDFGEGKFYIKNFLNIAIQNKNYRIVEALLYHGASLLLRDTDTKKNPLDYLKETNSDKIQNLINFYLLPKGYRGRNFYTYKDVVKIYVEKLRLSPKL